jgi:hypothetical protein
LKNSQLTDGESHVVYGTGHQVAKTYRLNRHSKGRKSRMFCASLPIIYSALFF